MSNISTTVQKKEKYKSRALRQDQCHCCSDFRALVRTIPNASNSAPLFAFNDEKTELALTSRRCHLLTFKLVDLTSRRWGVATLGRHDVGASRRWNIATFQSSLCTFVLCSRMLPKTALFAPIAPAFTPIALIRY